MLKLAEKNSLSIWRQLQNSQHPQNRPFGAPCHRSDSPTLSSMVSSERHEPACWLWQGTPKSSIFRMLGVLQLPLCRFPYLLFVFSLFFACSSHQSHWVSNQIYSNQRECYSTKLSYLSHDHVHGLDLEFLKVKERLNVYLNVHSIPVPAYHGNQKASLLKLDIAGEIINCEAYRLEGGQRFLLSDKIVNILIKSLKAHKNVTLFLPGYRLTIQAENFSKKFDQFLHPLPLQNPLRLPI